jgi:cation transport ATPase
VEVRLVKKAMQSTPSVVGLIAMPVAAEVSIRWSLDLPMRVGAVAMSMSTIIVAMNAQLLRRLKLRRKAPAEFASTKRLALDQL